MYAANLNLVTQIQDANVTAVHMQGDFLAGDYHCQVRDLTRPQLLPLYVGIFRGMHQHFCLLVVINGPLLPILCWEGPKEVKEHA